MTLREIIYLDRDRIDSYLSQLAGGLVVQESSDASKSEQLAGKVKASIKFVEFEVGGEKATGSTAAFTRIPAHAILAWLEQLLTDGELLADATRSTVLPGQIAQVRGEATFESWTLLAELADSIQGIATLAAKIYGAVQGDSDIKALRSRLGQIEQLQRKNAGDSKFRDLQVDLARDIKSRHVALSIVDAKYIEDVKDVVRLFFQDQNHFRISVPGGNTFVGLLRKEGLVGSTMEELLFTYGARPQHSFGALFYAAELGHDDGFDAAEMAERFKKWHGKPFSLAILQDVIREGGSALLQLAEELRRPAGAHATFVVPLAIYREIRAAKA